MAERTLPFEELSAEQQELALSLRDRIVPVVVRNATEALQSAGLSASIQVIRTGTRVEIRVQSSLPIPQHRRAENIVEDVLNGTMLRAAGKLH